MNAELEKNITFDESCAQDEVLTSQLLSANRTASARSEDQVASGKLERLDVLMWALCFAFGTLFGSQALPLIEQWFNK